MYDSAVPFDQSAADPAVSINLIHQDSPVEVSNDATGLPRAALSAATTRPPPCSETGDTATQQAILHVLITAIASGDQTALEKFYDLTVTRVFGVALRILRNQQDAEEIVGATYWQVWQSASDYRTDKAPVLGWLLMIARSRALDCRRSLVRQNQIKTEAAQQCDHEPAMATDDIESVYVQREQHTIINALLLELTPVQRQILHLAYFSEMSHQEIAKYTGHPVGTVKSHIRRALIRLRERWVI